MVDDKYSIVPMRKIEPFGNVEIDEIRGKLDPRGYSIATRKSKPNNDSSSLFSILSGRNLDIPKGIVDNPGRNLDRKLEESCSENEAEREFDHEKCKFTNRFCSSPNHVLPNHFPVRSQHLQNHMSLHCQNHWAH